MRKFFVISLCFAFVSGMASGLFAQGDGIHPDPNVIRFPQQSVPLGAVVNLAEAKADFGAFVANTQRVHTPGVDVQKDEFLRWKEEANRIAEQVRAQAAQPAQKTNLLNPPATGTNFFLHPADDIPNDNALAISAGGKILSSMNSQVRAYNSTGGSPVFSGTFSTFTQQVGLGSGIKFDPKIIYDFVNDRFILVFLYGDTPSSSNSVIAFSQTNDPGGSYNVYKISGNLNSLGVWADFPQIGISTEELFLSNNLFAGSTSQGSGLWQIRLADGYAGNALNYVSYYSTYFSLHPVSGAATLYGPHFYLISHQSTSTSNTLYVHKVTGNIASNPTMNSPMSFSSSVPYSIAPSADQKGTNTMLQTNDCRIQSSYFENNRVVYVQNSSVAGRPGIFYGSLFISPLGLSFSALSSTYIFDSELEISYPAVAYAGSQHSSGNNATFVSFNYCSPNHYASHGAVYLDGSGDVSPVGTLKAGTGPVGFGSEWRWGDYSDICERAGVEGEAWVSGSFGNGSSGTSTWATQITVPPPVSIEPPVCELGAELSVYPNPTAEMVYVDFPVAKSGRYSIVLIDEQGKQIAELVERNLSEGEARLSFSLSPVTAGVYFVLVKSGDEIVFRNKVVKANP